MISLDPSFIGSIAQPPKVPFTEAPKPFARLPRTERLRVQGKSDEPMEDGGEDTDKDANELPNAPGRPEKEKNKMRGKGKSMKRFLHKKRKNVIDPSTIAIKQKMATMREKQARRQQAVGGAEVAEEGARKSALSRFRK